MSIDTLFFVYVLEFLLLFLDHNVDEVNSFQIAKVQPQGSASQLLTSLPISAWLYIY